MTVIAEAGATKTDWYAHSPSGAVRSTRTQGINTATMSQEKISGIVSEAAAALNPAGESVKEVYFYGAGLLSDEMAGYFPGAHVECASDLLAAARAVCGHAEGVAAIIGTGSNSCLYDGEKIVRNIHCSGFILGDEGSAAVLGKLFISDYLKELVPELLSSEFNAEFGVDYPSAVKNVYRGEAPSRYLGSFAPWIMSRYGTSDYVRNLVDNNFRAFFERSLARYGRPELPVGIVGGFGAACCDILRKIAAEYGITISTITASPMEGLLGYHGFKA